MENLTPQQMDDNAELAARELEKLVGDGKLGTECMTIFLAWYSSWYLLAGHKRLGRMFVRMNKMHR